MKKVVILGNSVVGVKIAQDIRQNDPEAEIKIILLEESYPYNRDLFSAAISKDIPIEQILYKETNFYQQQRIELLTEAKVNRINFNRKKIYTEGRTQIDYDILVITGFYDNKYPPIKGTHKTGVYGFNKSKDLKLIVENLPFIDTVIIQSNSLFSLQIANAFQENNKEVYLICSQASEGIRQHQSEEQGLIVIENDEIEEILGDSNVKAVRLKTGKVIGGEAVIFTETTDNFKIFADYDLELINDRMAVNEHYQTNHQGVFAADYGIIVKPGNINDIAHKSCQDLEQEGACIAARIANNQENTQSIGNSENRQSAQPNPVPVSHAE